MLEELESLATVGGMALFTSASKHFVKTAGDSSLHSVPDLNSADRFQVLSLVYLKRSFWPWKKNKVKPTMVTLNDVVEKLIDTKAFISTKVLAESYKDTPSFKADGSMGAKIASELNIDVSTTDKFSLCVNFGDISKTEVKWESLEEGLAKSKAKIDHEIFKELAQKKRTTLCIVLESLACTKDSALSEEADLEGKGNVSATVPTTVSVDVHMAGEVEKTSHFSYVIPSNTVIAFSCTKLDLSNEGVLSMHVSVDKVDNIEAKVAENIDRLAQIKNELLPIVSSKKFQDMKSLLRELLHYPNCLEELLELVSTAYCTVEEGSTFALPVKEIGEQFFDIKGWKEFLEILGFLIPESMATGKIEFPRTDAEKLVHGSWALTEALSDLSEQDISCFLKCKSENKEVILNALNNAMMGKDTSYGEAGKILDADSNEKKFLSSLGFVDMETSDGKCLKWEGQSHQKITDAYAAVYTLL